MKISVRELLLEGGIIYPLYKIPIVQSLRKFKWARTSDRFEKLKNEKENLTHIIEHFEEYTSEFISPSSFFREKVVLEIGPGVSCGMSLYFLARGSKKVVMVDREHRFFLDKKDELVVKDLCDYLENTYGATDIYSKAFEINNSRLILNPKSLEAHYGGITNVPLPDSSVDFIFSNAVMEHVSDVEVAFAEMNRLLKPGSYMAHNVDLRVHGPIKKTSPLAHLQYADWEWKLLTARKMSYINRLRRSDFEKLLNKTNFELLHMKNNDEATDEYIDEIRSQFINKFREMDVKDIKTLGISIVAKKVN